MGHGDICFTGLSLRLGYEGRRLLASDGHRRKDQSVTLDDPRTPETSLTLGPLTDEMHRSIPVKNDASMAIEETRMGRQSSPHSAVSSFSNVYQSSVKKEKDLAVERVSSQISDKDEEGSARKKLRLTKGQSALLEDMFKENSTLNPQKQKQALAKQLKLRPRQVEVWFQNRRARTKLKQTEVDCEFLKKCCEKLTDENWRLQKELQELKALKFSPAASLYMQLPSAATLTMCPSCERIGGATDMSSSAGAHSLMMTPKPHFFNPFSHSSSAAC